MTLRIVDVTDDVFCLCLLLSMHLYICMCAWTVPCHTFKMTYEGIYGESAEYRSTYIFVCVYILEDKMDW